MGLETGTAGQIPRPSLREFVSGAWSTLEPGIELLPSFHVDAICQHLEAVSDGRIRRLLINVPPGSMKSLLVAVFWPAWEWIESPGIRWMFASYAERLSVRDSVRCRDLIRSDWYQGRWGDRYQIKDDQNVKVKFENTRTGWRMATSVAGVGTGERVDRIVADDANNVVERESEPRRAAVIDWWSRSMSTRDRDPATSARVIVAQRVHQEDLSGFCLESGDYEHLMIPMEYESSRSRVTSIGWKDPRTEDGELMCPNRFMPADVERMKRELAVDATGQLQQDPRPGDAGMFKAEWFSTVDAVPAEAERIRYWDKAGTAGGGAYSCGVLVARSSDGVYYVQDVVRGQWSPGDRNRIMLQTAAFDHEQFQGRVTIWVEQEPGSGGKESAQESVRQLSQHPVYLDRVSTSKETRAHPLSTQAQCGNVKLLKAAWNRDFVNELIFFPRGKYADQVDAASGAYSKLAANASSTMMGELICAYGEESPGGDDRLLREAREDGTLHPVFADILDHMEGRVVAEDDD